MPLASLLRNTAVASVTITNGANLSNAFNFHEYALGVLHMPSAWTAASIGFKVCATAGGTYLPLYDKNGSLVQISGPAVDQAHVLPADLAGCHWVKLWSQDGAAANTNQGAARTLTLDLKA